MSRNYLQHPELFAYMEQEDVFYNDLVSDSLRPRTQMLALGEDPETQCKCEECESIRAELASAERVQNECRGEANETN